MMNVAERKQSTAPAEAQGWLARFEGALQSQDAAAAAALFLDDGLWRDLLAFTWTIRTMAGRAAIQITLRETLARTKPVNIRIPAKRTPPRWISRADREAIECIFQFDTAFGPANGVVRPVRRTAQHVAAHGARRLVVHRRQPRAMPHLLALSGAADQGAGRRAVERGRALIMQPNS
jgi:hypothetical protein